MIDEVQPRLARGSGLGMTFLGFRPHDKVGVIALASCGDPGPGFPETVRTLFLGAE